ncbi:Uncharacterized protein DBV15_02631 [Temnothorax longispinosus]|uniref:Uncharacterized protein n=1 Tax=Temnothorax longispinosus TaxID=300112 RepID=A0A4S2K8U2_9HYME|nr:Uncharacterized protein DBV15_02631 [Temnothorax longispinosus]
MVKKLKGYLWRGGRKGLERLGEESKKQVGRRRDSGTQDSEEEGRREVKKLRRAVIEWDELTNSTAILEHGQDRDFYRWASRQAEKEGRGPEGRYADARDDSYDR